MNKITTPRGYGKSSTLADLIWENTLLKQQNEVLLEYAKCKFYGCDVPYVLINDVYDVLEKLRDR